MLQTRGVFSKKKVSFRTLNPAGEVDLTRPSRERVVTEWALITGPSDVGAFDLVRVTICRCAVLEVLTLRSSCDAIGSARTSSDFNAI